MPFDATLGQTVVVALRLVVPLLIFRRPLLGGVLSMLLDATDVIIVEVFGPGGMGGRYHQLDKVLDLYYLSFEAWVSRAWVAVLPRTTSLALFGWRVLGVGLFELSGARWLLFLFPNLFEHWFLFVLARNRWFPGVRLDSWRRIAAWLLVLLVPKLGQEYLLHVAEAQPWSWFKENVLGE